jgi:hypothetical protein
MMKIAMQLEEQQVGITATNGKLILIYHRTTIPNSVRVPAFEQEIEVGCANKGKRQRTEGFVGLGGACPVNEQQFGQTFDQLDAREFM